MDSKSLKYLTKSFNYDSPQKREYKPSTISTKTTEEQALNKERDLTCWFVTLPLDKKTSLKDNHTNNPYTLQKSKQLDEENTLLKQELDKTKATIRALQEELDDQINTNDSLVKELNQLKDIDKKYSELEDELITAVTDYNKAKEYTNVLQEEHDNLLKKLKEYEAFVQSVIKKHDDQNYENKTLKSDKADLKRDLLDHVDMQDKLKHARNKALIAHAVTSFELDRLFVREHGDSKHYIGVSGVQGMSGYKPSPRRTRSIQSQDSNTNKDTPLKPPSPYGKKDSNPYSLDNFRQKTKIFTKKEGTQAGKYGDAIADIVKGSGGYQRIQSERTYK